jgi:hypothetical protein
MKITKRQLRRIIRESILYERHGNPALSEIEHVLRRTIAEYANTYMMSMAMDPSDIADVKRTRKTIDEIITSVVGT